MTDDDIERIVATARSIESLPARSAVSAAEWRLAQGIMELYGRWMDLKNRSCLCCSGHCQNGCRCAPMSNDKALDTDRPDHDYLSAGDNPYTSGGKAYFGCSLCGRSRLAHQR